MAHIKISLLLLPTLVAALLLTQSNLQSEAVNLHKMKCESYLATIENCWTEHSDLPSCAVEDDLLECAEDAKNNARHCTDSIKEQIDDKYELYKNIRDTLCENMAIRDEFEKKKTCWHTARACASSMAGMSDDSSEEADIVDCAGSLSLMQQCNKLSGPGCEEIQNNFTMGILEASPCSVHSEELLNGGESVILCNFITALILSSFAASANW